MKRISIFSGLVLMVTMACAAEPKTDLSNNNTDPVEAAKIKAELVNSELKNPWGMAFLPDGKILITEKEGRIVLLENGAITNSDVSGGPQAKVQGQGGLLDIEMHPDFESNRWVYFTYASGEGEGNGAMTALGRAQWNGSSFENF
ncbi:MAG: PQQ-dependent sugar dehydrogenase, partial [Cytophagia bacterium]|nr:PQQ-dependent sugar dehydrogenase [Cytophagia bacterium]